MLERNLILKETHVIMVSLKTMGHNEQMDANEASLRSNLLIVSDLIDLALANFVGVLHFLEESLVSVDAVALFKDDWAHLSKRFLHPFSLNF